MTHTVSPRGIFIAGNWKMNHDQKATDLFFSELRSKWKSTLSQETLTAIQKQDLRIALFPPFLSLERAKKATDKQAIEGLPILIGAQNGHWAESGAFTGEISGPMLKEMNIPLVLIGHSERRQYFGETNVTVRKRSEALLAHGFSIIFCIGETREEREKGKTQEILLRQLEEGLPTTLIQKRFFIAYEPVWAIGTGLTATPEQAEEAHKIIRKFLWEKFDMEKAAQTPLLYGGSVTPENASSLLSRPNVDGALVGGASLKPESFLALIEAGSHALK